jgi:glyceraldehyde-3-phosphate dehydrogenase (NADP+)
METTKLDIFKSNTLNTNEIPFQFPYHQVEYLIDGEIRTWNGDMNQVNSPIFYNKEGEFSNIIGSYPLMDTETALLALESAVNAYKNGTGEWPKMGLENRINCMLEFVRLMKLERTKIVHLLMWEIGKTQKDSEKEFDRTIDYILDTIQALKELDRNSSRLTIEQGIIAQIKRSPLGVVLCMGPFNYPLNETFTTLIPALIMGNTVVFKPPKLGVLLHSPLLKAFQKAFPKGVVNIVYGEGQKVITPILESGKINVLAFIGSCRVADILKKQHPKPHLMKAVLGLEAKNPAIILPDANLDETVKECITGALSFNGQRCTALKILFVHETIHDIFVEKLVSEIEKLKVGLPWEPGVSITPLPEANKTEYLTGLVEDALNKGGKVANPSGNQYYKTVFFPTVLTDVSDKMRIFNEEQFGPIVPIVKYSSIDEPLNYVISSNYGQQTSIFGKDHEAISELVDTFVNQVCRVNINSQCQRGPDVFPFTGRKDSAEGTLSVSDALRVFSIRTLVALKETEENKEILRKILLERSSGFLSTEFIL